MFPVISRPADDDEIVKIYMAHHETNNYKKAQAEFEKDWEACLEKLLPDNPEFNVSQVIVAMKRKGWLIIPIEPAKVTY